MVPDIEKAILRSNLGVTPTSTGDVIRLMLPPLTEENRRDLSRQARNETEQARVAIRNVRRDANHDIREFLKEKEITEDEAHRAIQDIQKVTDERVEQAGSALERKENDLMEI